MMKAKANEDKSTSKIYSIHDIEKEKDTKLNTKSNESLFNAGHSDQNKFKLITQGNKMHMTVNRLVSKPILEHADENIKSDYSDDKSNSKSPFYRYFHYA